MTADAEAIIDTVDSILICNIDVSVYQAHAGGPYRCVQCLRDFAAGDTSPDGEIESYRCLCGVEVSAMKAHQDVARFRDLLQRTKEGREFFD